MSGPIVRTGTTPKYWANWDNVFGGKKAAPKKTAASKDAPEKKSTPVKSAKPAAKKTPAKKKAKK